MPAHTNCAGVTRRDCLQLGLGTLLGGGLATTLRARASGPGATPAQAKACILVWMDGGPTHYEMFDPKPTAPAEFRGEFRAIPTAVPGVQFSEHMTKLAAQLGKYAMIRSIRHDQGNHGAGNHYMMTGAPPRIPVGCGAFVSFHPSLGSVTAAEKGAPAGLPAYFSMPEMSRSGGPNFLGAKHAPFVSDGDPNSSGFRIRDVALPTGITEGRFADRSSLRSDVDRFQRLLDKSSGDPAVALDDHYQQANELMRSKEAQAAFRIGDEPPKVRDRYGRNSFGQRLLLARRLLEAGVPFITINDGGWDHHSDLFGALQKRLPGWDSSVSALISDLDERGMRAALRDFEPLAAASSVARRRAASNATSWRRRVLTKYRAPAGTGTPSTSSRPIAWAHSWTSLLSHRRRFPRLYSTGNGTSAPPPESAWNSTMSHTPTTRSRWETTHSPRAVRPALKSLP